MLSCNVLIAHSVGDLEGEIRIFVEAEPGFCLAFRIVPDGGIFFGVFSHGLQLAEVGGYGLVLYDIYLSQPVYYRAVAPGAVMVETQDEGSQARLLKYESILLLVLRLLYLQKRESLAASADQVLVTVEEVQTELQKMNLPRRLDQQTLERLMRTLRRYNLARPVGRLTGLDSRIEVFPTVLLALPDADLADAAAESARTRTELGLYERPEGADTAAGEAEE